MKKISLIALAVPALFAACSQEDIVSNVQGQSGELLGKVAGDVEFVFNNTPETRMTWAPDGNADGAIQWNPNGDAFSLFWVGNTEYEAQANYNGVANALYKSTDGNRFQSENIIYEGNHIIVYPADYAHYSEKAIEVSVPEPQSSADDLGTKRTVAVSDLLLIKAPLTGKDADKNMAADTKANGTIWAGGYGKDVTAPINVLSSHLVLNLNFDLKKLDNVEIRSVKLVSDKATFATKGNLYKNTDGFISLNATKAASTITLNTNKAIVNADNKSYQAQISLLPPVKDAIDAAYSIVVETNYGIITIDKALDVTSTSGAAQFKPFEVTGKDGKPVAGVADDKTPLSFFTEFTNIATRDLDTDSKTQGNQSEESYGKRIIRNVKVDMSKASIENWPVQTSTDLINAYTIYDNLERGTSKNPEENFVLEGVKIDSKKTPTYFSMTPQAYEAMKAHAKVTLSVGANLAEIRLEAKDGKTFTEVPNLSAIPASKAAVKDNPETEADETAAAVVGKKDLDLVVSAGNIWAVNILDAKNANDFKSLKNKGEVTVTSVNNDSKDGKYKGVRLAGLTNDGGTVNFSGAVVMDPTVYTQNSGETKVGEGVSVTLNAEGNSIAGGKVTVTNKLVVNNTTTISKGAKVNVAGSFLTTNNATLTNLGEITLENATASTIITENGSGTSMGIINLFNRTSSAKVNGSNQGYIKWTMDSSVQSKNLQKGTTDAFNYVIVDRADVQLTSAAGQVSYLDYLEIKASKVDLTTPTSGATITGLFVNSGKTLVVKTGSKLTATNTTLNGDIEVYGTLSEGAVTGKGIIYDFSE